MHRCSAFSTHRLLSKYNGERNACAAYRLRRIPTKRKFPEHLIQRSRRMLRLEQESEDHIQQGMQARRVSFSGGYETTVDGHFFVGWNHHHHRIPFLISPSFDESHLLRCCHHRPYHHHHFRITHTYTSQSPLPPSRPTSPSTSTPSLPGTKI